VKIYWIFGVMKIRGRNMGKVLSFINMKGGVGKTTLAVNIGYTLSKEFSKKVLLIDVDPK